MNKLLAFLAIVVIVIVVSVGSGALHSLTETPAGTLSVKGASSFKSTQPLVASGDCQSRFWGKLNGVTGATAKDILVVVNGGKAMLETSLDPSGLFGFAGLCAGDYTVSLQVAGKTTPLPNRIQLDGKNTVQQDLAYK